MVVGLGVLAVACGDEAAELPPPETSTSSTSPPTTPAPPPTTPVPTEEEQILAAYQGYWDTWLAANDPPDPDHPDLARYYTGVSLDRARQSIAANAAQGRVLRLPAGSQYEHRAVVRLIDGDQAVVEDCAIDDGHVIDAATGDVLDSSVVTNRAEVTLKRVGEEWLVSDVIVIERWDGVAGCAAASAHS
jgi:hypothetical protein